MKPRVFIGSSQESTPIAYAIQENLDRSAEVTVWDQGIFDPSTYVLDALAKALTKYDFGVFVFSAEDIVKIRGREYLATRDNVLFELGLFMGHFGRERTFIVSPAGVTDFRLPTDLLGLSLLAFNADRQDGNWTAALGPACSKMTQILRRFESGATTLPTPVPQPQSPGQASAINIDLPEFICFSHNLGLVQALIFVSLANAGDRTESFSRLHLMLRHESGQQINLRARSYFLQGASVQEYPMIRTSLKAGDSWFENVRFYRLRTDAKQAEVDDLARKTQSDVTERRGRQSDPNQLTEVSGELCLRAVARFEQDLDLLAGKYQGVAAALSPDSAVLAVSGFELDLPEASLRALVETTKEGYRWGSGVYYPNNNAFIWCRITALEDDVARQLYAGCDPKSFD
jgi:hypothetical protein